MTTKNSIFYGFWIAVASFIILAITSGSVFYGYIILNKIIADDFGWSRAQVTLAYFISTLSMAICVPFVGGLVDRSGPRKIILVGIVLVSVALAILSQVTELWQYLVLHVFIGVGFVMAGFIAISYLISSWFSKLRGIMQGITLGGMGFGGLLMSPIIGKILVPYSGWRGTYLILGAACFIILLPLAIFVLRDKPAQKNLSAYGKNEDTTAGIISSGERQLEGFSVRQALKVPAFWLIVVSSLMAAFGSNAVLQNHVSILTWRQFQLETAMASVGAIGLLSTASKFLFGFLCDRFDAKYATALSYFLIAASIVVLVLAKTPSAIWLYIVLLGLGEGGWAPILAMLTSSYFGLKNYGALAGFINMSTITVASIAPFILGLFYDRTSTYVPMLIILIGICTIAGLMVALIRKPVVTRITNA